MKRPIFRAEATRDTNAPLAVVREALQAKDTWKHWCIACQAIQGRVDPLEMGGLEITYTQCGPLGLTFQGTLRATPSGSRVVLEHQAVIRGWAILVLIGWYRWRIEGMWERFVRGLPGTPDI